MEAQWQIDVVNRITGVDLSEQNVLSSPGGSCSGWCIDGVLKTSYRMRAKKSLGKTVACELRSPHPFMVGANH
jgi:hypothetical protein